MESGVLLPRIALSLHPGYALTRGDLRGINGATNSHIFRPARDVGVNSYFLTMSGVHQLEGGS